MGISIFSPCTAGTSKVVSVTPMEKGTGRSRRKSGDTVVTLLFCRGCATWTLTGGTISSTLNNSSTRKGDGMTPVPFSLLAYTIRDADSGRGHHRRRHRRRKHRLSLDRGGNEERPHS